MILRFNVGSKYVVVDLEQELEGYSNLYFR